MATEKTPKISKTIAIQLIDGQIDQFSLLRSTDADLEERFLPLFIQTVSIIYQILSEEDALSFMENVVPDFGDTPNEVAFIEAIHNEIKDLFTESSDKFIIEHIFHRNEVAGLIKMLPFGILDALIRHEDISESLLNQSVLKAAIGSTGQLTLYKMKIAETWKDDQLYPTIQVGGNLNRIGDIINSRVSGLVQGERNTVGSDKEE